ncbi:MAG: chemotaxis protein CheW [SAR202 cluster bacterium]|nr:chemotaxis protein CheW [SAR202 cluster bacterium]
MDNSASAIRGGDERQLVVFDLAAEAYGVEIGSVREIIRMQEITQVPRTPDYVEGVINLRGRVIPVVDMRKRFGFPVAERTKDTRIVVIDIGGADIGAVVDAVTEVLRLGSDSIEPPSAVITTADSDYLLGIAKLETRLIILLDLQRALAVEAMQAGASLPSSSSGIESSKTGNGSGVSDVSIESATQVVVEESYEEELQVAD